MTRRGFTALEMILAMTLAALVAVASMSLFIAIDRGDRLLSERFDSMSRMTNTHRTVRIAMQSLLGARNVVDPLAAESPEGREAIEAERAIVREDEPEPRLLLETYGEAEALGLIQRYGLNLTADEAGSFLKRLRLTLSRSPIPALPSYYWGVVGELRTAPDQGRWRLIWQPLEPLGDPVVLQDDLVLVLCQALVQNNEWVAETEAFERREFPRAIRLTLWTDSGTRNDWIFEPGVTVGKVGSRP